MMEGRKLKSFLYIFYKKITFFMYRSKFGKFTKFEFFPFFFHYDLLNSTWMAIVTLTSSVKYAMLK